MSESTSINLSYLYKYLFGPSHIYFILFICLSVPKERMGNDESKAGYDNIINEQVQR